jgi:hypothetical protein
MSWPRVSHPSVAREEIDLAPYLSLCKIFLRSARPRRPLAYGLKCTVTTDYDTARRVDRMASFDLDHLFVSEG